MQERLNHDKYLNQTIEVSSLARIKSYRYRQIINKYGNWLVALVKEKIKPITKEQEDFIYEFKKVSNKNHCEVFDNEYIAALCLWKGFKWVSSVSYSLRFKNTRTIEKGKSNNYYASLKPNVKLKKKKLDPTRTYRWSDQGFQTREGHKIMRNRYPM